MSTQTPPTGMQESITYLTHTHGEGYTDTLMHAISAGTHDDDRGFSHGVDAAVEILARESGDTSTARQIVDRHIAAVRAALHAVQPNYSASTQAHADHQTAPDVGHKRGRNR